MRIFLLPFLALASYGAESWEEVRTGPFEVWTNTNEKEARQLLVRLEQLRYVIGTMLGKQDPVSTWTIRVLIAKTKAPATDWKLGRDAWISTIPSGQPVSAAWQMHIARLLLEANARVMPDYWEKGLLAFFSTLDAQGPKITLGTPPPASEQTLDWARVHFLWTNPEFTARLRVLINNLQNGADEETGYRNSLGQPKAGIEKQVAAHFAKGDFQPLVFSGRAISERDFYTRPIEPERASAALADAAANPKLPATGTLESAESLGLANRSLDELKKAVTLGSKSARVHLAYGLLLTDAKAKQEAFVEAAKKNPRWAQPYIELANLEKAPERQAFYLKTAVTLNPRDSEVWQRLARMQLEANQFSEASKSWYSAELATPSAAGREKIRLARRQFEQDRADREDAEKRRIADERQRELNRLKEQALNEVRAAEARANKGGVATDPPVKVEEWWDDKQPSQKITGQLQKVDCLGKSARIWIVTPGAPKTAKPTAFWIRDSGQVVVMGNGDASFGCGVQQPLRNVSVEFKPRPDTKQGTQGDVTVIEFR